jgi:hypothetical protein
LLLEAFGSKVSHIPDRFPAGGSRHEMRHGTIQEFGEVLIRPTLSGRMGLAWGLCCRPAYRKRKFSLSFIQISQKLLLGNPFYEATGVCSQSLKSERWRQEVFENLSIMEGDRVENGSVYPVSAITPRSMALAHMERSEKNAYVRSEMM